MKILTGHEAVAAARDPTDGERCPITEPPKVGSGKAIYMVIRTKDHLSGFSYYAFNIEPKALLEKNGDNNRALDMKLFARLQANNKRSYAYMGCGAMGSKILLLGGTKRHEVNSRDGNGFLELDTDNPRGKFRFGGRLEFTKVDPYCVEVAGTPYVVDGRPQLVTNMFEVYTPKRLHSSLSFRSVETRPELLYPHMSIFVFGSRIYASNGNRIYYNDVNVGGQWEESEAWGTHVTLPFSGSSAFTFYFDSGNGYFFSFSKGQVYLNVMRDWVLKERFVLFNVGKSNFSHACFTSLGGGNYVVAASPPPYDELEGNIKVGIYVTTFNFKVSVGHRDHVKLDYKVDILNEFLVKPNIFPKAKRSNHLDLKVIGCFAMCSTSNEPEMKEFVKKFATSASTSAPTPAPLYLERGPISITYKLKNSCFSKNAIEGQFGNEMATFVMYDNLPNAIAVKMLLNLYPCYAFIECKAIIVVSYSNSEPKPMLVMRWYNSTLETVLKKSLSLVCGNGILRKRYRSIIRSIFESTIEAFKRGLVPRLEPESIFIREDRAVISKFQILDDYSGWNTKFPIHLERLMKRIFKGKEDEVSYCRQFMTSLKCATTIHTLRACLRHPMLMDPVKRFRNPVLTMLDTSISEEGRSMSTEDVMRLYCQGNDGVKDYSSQKLKHLWYEKASNNTIVSKHVKKAPTAHAKHSSIRNGTIHFNDDADMKGLYREKLGRDQWLNELEGCFPGYLAEQHNYSTACRFPGVELWIDGGLPTQFLVYMRSATTEDGIVLTLPFLLAFRQILFMILTYPTSDQMRQYVKSLEEKLHLLLDLYLSSPLEVGTIPLLLRFVDNYTDQKKKVARKAVYWANRCMMFICKVLSNLEKIGLVSKYISEFSKYENWEKEWVNEYKAFVRKYPSNDILDNLSWSKEIMTSELKEMDELCIKIHGKIHFYLVGYSF